MAAHPLYLLQIVDPENGALVRFSGRGEVERDLVASLTQQITSAILARGSWWLRRDRLEAAVTEAAAEGIHAALMDVKREASVKGGHA